MIPEIGELLRLLTGTGGSSSQRLARGGVWVFFSYGVGQILSLIRSMILARLLTPADFGLVGMVFLSLSLLAIFTETGIWPALIQRPELDRPTLNTAWLISAGRGLLLGAITLIAAPWIARFFEAPLLEPMLRVMTLSFVLSGFSSLGLVLLQREMDFRLLTVVSLAAAAVNLVTATVAAFFLRSAWALIVGVLAGSFVALVLSYLVHPFRPQLRFDRQRARELFGFGKYLTVSGIITYLCTEGDDAYVGKVLGAEPLGLYRLAYRLSNLPATSISHVINRVTLPAFSALQEDRGRMGSLYLQTLRLTALVAVPLAGGMFALAPYLVGVLYGSQWAPAVPSFMVLCFFGLERAIGSIAGPVLLALGKPRLVMYVGLSKLVTMALCIVPLTRAYGILGTSIAVTLSAVVVQAVVLPVTARLLGIPITGILQQVAKPLAVTALMVAVLFGVRQVVEWPVDLLPLAVLSFLGLLVYAVIVLPTERHLLSKVKASLWPGSIAQEIEAVEEAGRP